MMTMDLRSPYIVSAAMQFDERLEKMAAYYERTLQIYHLLEAYPNLCVNPEKPHVNMMHLYLPFSSEKAILLRDTLANEQKIWLGNPQQAAQPNQCFIEWYIGDNLLNTDDNVLKRLTIYKLAAV